MVDHFMKIKTAIKSAWTYCDQTVRASFRLTFTKANVKALVAIGCFVFVIVTTAYLLIKCVWNLWSNVVTDQEFLIFSVLASGFIIFLCSCSELAIANTTDTEIEKWNEKNPNHPRWKDYLRIVKEQKALLNITVILANAIAAIAMTELVVKSLNQQDDFLVSFHAPLVGWTLFTLKAPDAFTTIGATVILFGAAELLPKQIAMRMKVRATIRLCCWIVPLGIVFFPVAYGVIGPLRLLGFKDEEIGS